MTTQTLTLTDFLLARIAHDQRVYSGHQHGLRPELAERLLAECEAKRRIVAIHTRGTEQWQPSGDGTMPDWADWALCSCSGDYPCRTLLALALPYADHPDYREEWRP